MGSSRAIGDEGRGRPRGDGGTDERLVRLADLSVGYSPRQLKVDEDHVTVLAEVIDRLPPIVVDEQTMRVIDGVHRLEAFRRAGRSEIKALLFSGDETAALVMAIQSNVTHGKPLSRGERQAAAGTLLRRSPERSDRWVGEICGLSHSTVARLRRVSDVADRDIRTGRDGRRRPVDPRPGHAAVAKALTAGPAMSIREAAGTAGVAPSTAHRVAAELRGQGTPFVAGAVTASSGEGPAVIERGNDPKTDPPAQAEEAASWLERTAVDPDDLKAHLESVPLGRVYEVVDECRRRARTWSEVADALEKKARTRRGPRPG